MRTAHALEKLPLLSAARFLRPDGTALDTARNLHGTAGALVQRHQALGLGIDEQTATTLWRGEVMDYGMALDVLFQRDVKSPPDETNCAAR